MGKHIKKKIAVGVILIFTIFIVITAFVYPETGERIIYGKKGLEKKQYLEYSEIILSGNYACMESASNIADGDLPKFVKEFNECNNKK